MQNNKRRTKKLKRQQTFRQLPKRARFKRFLKPSETRIKPIKFESDFQVDWARFIPALSERSIVKWEQVGFLSVMGDAPKDFITDREEAITKRAGNILDAQYIAKVGSKFYPIESVIEQLLTRIGQTYEINIADSKLRIVEGQVRFMSRYFLDRHNEQLTHGAEILAGFIGKEKYQPLEKDKVENKFFTFEMVCRAIENAFPDASAEETSNIIESLVKMMAFDALIGHNDRHPYNWGVVVPVAKNGLLRFSPIYDTARALFWNIPERKIKQMITDKRQFEDYVRKCEPPFCWNNEPNVDFFSLLGLIWNERESSRQTIEKFMSIASLEKGIKIVDDEFKNLLSAERRELIARCLRSRRQSLENSIKSFRERIKAE